MPGASHWPGEHPVRLVIIGESFAFGIPFQLFTQPHGNLAQQANAAGAVTHLDGGDCFLS
jgi:hypothetical protein